MTIDTVVTAQIACPMQTAFDGASSTEGLPAIFPGKGPIPGVISAEVMGGGPIGVGKVRRVKTKDGNELDESYIQFDRPTGYAYEMSKFKAPLSLLMTKATGTWRFSEEGTHTRIVWTYSCEVASALAWPITGLVVKVFMKAAMNDCLMRLKRGIETPST